MSIIEEKIKNLTLKSETFPFQNYIRETSTHPLKL